MTNREFWTRTLAVDFGYGWEELANTADPYDPTDMGRFVPESDMGDDNREHDLGFGCAYGIEYAAGVPFTVCETHGKVWPVTGHLSHA